MKPLVAIATLLAAAPVVLADQAAPKLPADLQGIGIDQRLNAQLPLNTVFNDESGRSVRLGQFLGKRPAILAFVYYRCTMLCSYILEGIVRGLRPLALTPGSDFNVIAISIDPHEDFHDSAKAHDQYARSYSSTRGRGGWHFLTGADDNIHAVANAAGFHYRYDPKSKAFVHASGIIVLTPDGRAARYLYGVEFAPKDLKLGLMEASAGRIGSPIDRILLFCYHYDPATGKYSAAVINLMRAAATAVLMFLVTGLTILWRKDIRAGRISSRELRDS